MDENNTNGFGNTDDEYEDEGTTVLTTPGVSAFANAQGAGQSGDARHCCRNECQERF